MNQTKIVDQEKITALLKRVEDLKNQGLVDLSADEDLALAVMNLVSLEEHLFFTGAKTGAGEYYDLSGAVREIRKGLMKKFLPQTTGETWCATKHLLAAAMRLIEVGQKNRQHSDTAQADEMFRDAYRLYGIAWTLKLGLADTRAFADRSADAVPLSVEDLVAKLANCCDE